MSLIKLISLYWQAKGICFDYKYSFSSAIRCWDISEWSRYYCCWAKLYGPFGWDGSYAFFLKNRNTWDILSILIADARVSQFRKDNVTHSLLRWHIPGNRNPSLSKEKGLLSVPSYCTKSVVYSFVLQIIQKNFTDLYFRIQTM